MQEILGIQLGYRVLTQSLLGAQLHAPVDRMAGQPYLQVSVVEPPPTHLS